MTYELVEEPLLPPWLRRQLALLLAEAFPEAPVAAVSRTWLQFEPTFRILCLESARSLVGQQSVMKVADHPPVMGLGDIAVARRARERSIGAELVRRAVEETVRRGPAAIVTATTHPALVPVFEALGFRPVRPFECFVEEDAHVCRYDPAWLLRRCDARAPRRLQLAGFF